MQDIRHADIAYRRVFHTVYRQEWGTPTLQNVHNELATGGCVPFQDVVLPLPPHCNNYRVKVFFPIIL